MGKKRTWAIMVILVAIVAAASAQNIQSTHSQDQTTTEAVSLSRVAVIGYSNETEDDAFEIPAKTATDTLLLALKQLRRYDVVDAEYLTDIPASQSDDQFLTWSHLHNYDYVLYGAITAAKDGTQEYRLGVFDRVKQKTTIEKTAQGESLLDVFSVSDALCVSMLQAITGRHIGFGSIAFTSPDEKSDGEVILDGYAVSRGTAAIDRVIAGKHQLQVLQDGENAQLMLFNQTITVTENGRTDVPLLAARDAVVVPKSKDALIWTGKDRWTGYEDSQLNKGTSRCVLFEDREVIGGTLYHTFSAIGATTGDDKESFAGLCVSPSGDNAAKLRAAGGISFKFEGDGKDYRLMVGTTDLKDADWYQKKFSAKVGQTIEVRIPWSALRQEGWGFRAKFDKKNIAKIAVETVTGGFPSPFSFKLYDIRAF